VPRRSSSRAPQGTALDAGLRLLALRAHSRAELRQKLRRRGFDATAIEAASVRLSELGYLDDAAFARGFVRRRSSSRGPLALSAELAARGIDRAGAETAIAAFDPQAQLASAVSLAGRLLGGAGGSYEQVLGRVGPKLMRRGFSSGVVRTACRAVAAGAQGPPDD
jgi:regulatory protein